MSFNTGKTSVTGNVTSVTVAYTYINIATTGNAGVQNAYTVPANKKFKLYGVLANNSAAGQYCNVYKTDGTTAVAFTAYGGTTSIQMHVPIWEYAAGEIVKVNCSNTHTYFIVGTLEDA